MGLKRIHFAQSVIAGESAAISSGNRHRCGNEIAGFVKDSRRALHNGKLGTSDACTTGGSLFHAIDAAEAAGCAVGLVLAVLDRSEAIRQRGYPFTALLTAGEDGQIRPA